MRVVFFTFLSIVLMTVDHQQKYLDDVRAVLSLLVYPIQLLVSLPDTMGHWAEENMVSRESLIEDNATLRSQNIFLKQQHQKLISLEVENMRLRHLLGASDKVSDKILTAEIDLSKTERTRRSWPFFRDRRIDAYDDLIRLNID